MRHLHNITPLRRLALLLLLLCARSASAQTAITYTDADEWQAYEDFNTMLFDKSTHIYKSDTEQKTANHRGNGARDKDYSGCAAAIWCQAIYVDMAINAYNRAVAENDAVRTGKYKTFFTSLYKGEKAHYVNFNFDNPNTDNGWFVYDDIMWWTCALARAYKTFGTTEYLTYSEKSFCRVWYGSAKVGDDGSYADPSRFEGKYGGGMFWEWQPIDHANPHKPGDFRSACINFPTVIAACLLHELVPEGRTAPTAARPTRQTKEWYLEKAKEIYAWASSTLTNNAGRVADGIHGGDAEYTDHIYNQATYLGASCLLYKLTGETKYKTNAIRCANYIFTSMSGTSNILPLETGYEQGIYTAILAQYLPMFINEMGHSETVRSKYLGYVQKNIQRAWGYRDTVRGIHDGNFRKATPTDKYIESYGASAMPALMLMFPVGDSQTAVDAVSSASRQTSANVYSIDGRVVMKEATPRQLNSLDSGLYVYQNRKLAVR